MALAIDGERVLERLRALPGGAELLALAAEHDGEVELVGGAVRDIALERYPRELDVVVERDAERLAAALGERLGSEPLLHERFGTAVVRAEHVQIDIATMRAESYASPGTLPQVRPGSPEQDLARRDFSVNAIAVALTGPRRGELRCAPGALEDLAAGRLRVLHDRSFLDDPTRVLRLARYATRLGFQIDPHTEELARTALAGGALKSVSGQRLGGELRLALQEPEPVAALAALDRLGVLAAWESGLSFDAQLALAGLALLPGDGRPQRLLCAALLLGMVERLEHEDAEPEMRGFLYDLQLPAGEGERVFDTAIDTEFVAHHAGGADTVDDILELTEYTSIEALALAGALCEASEGPGSYGKLVIEEWLRQGRHVTPQVTGDDLIAAGVPEGPEIGARLRESYKALLEEEIEPGRDSELRAALDAQV